MVFYFSGTGNSKYIAKKVAKELNEEIINIADYVEIGDTELNLKSKEKIGIVFPTYFYGFPLIIEKFFKNLEAANICNEVLNNRYIYIIYNYEAYGGGLEFKVFSAFRKMNISLSYISSVKMPNNFSIYYNLPSKEKEQEILNIADTEIDKIIEDIKNEKINKANKNIIRRIVTSIMYPIYKYGRKTKRFYADDKCINCELCEKVCPVNAIKMNDRKPEWVKAQCEYCLACYNRCPVNSIQIGNWTLKRRRYYNPNID